MKHLDEFEISRVTGLLLTTTLVLGPFGHASAASNSDQLEEITVTATRFATSVQDIPVAVSAIGGQAMRDAGIVDPNQLTGLAPGLVVDQGAATGQFHASIRGQASTDFGLGAQSPVAVYLDDVYQPFEYGLGTQVYDLNRIEVLRGPQSTLFGKNTTGGGIAYYSMTPTQEDEGYFSVDAGGGTYRHVAGEGAVNKALTDSLAARLSFRVDQHNKYITNLVDGSKRGDNQSYNGRLQFAWRPAESTDINLKLHVLHSTGDSPAFVGKLYANACNAGGGFVGSYWCTGSPPVLVTSESIDPLNVYSLAPTYEQASGNGLTLKIEQSLGDYKLTSITNAQHSQFHQSTYDTGLSQDAFHSRLRSYTRQVSEELRLNTSAINPLRAVIGLFGMYDYIKQLAGSGATQVPDVMAYLTTSAANQKTTSWAVFSAVTYDMTARFGVVGGVRYTSETKDITNRFFAGGGVVIPDAYLDDYDATVANVPGGPPEISSAKHTWNKVTWEGKANFKPTDDQLLYGSIATGFRSGGYPIGTTAPDTFKEFQPETVTSYEVGYKSEWLDHRLRFNGDVYYTDYKDMQVQVIDPNLVFTLIRQNAAAAKIKGVELELESKPTQALNVRATFGYTDATYRSYTTAVLDNPEKDLSGYQLPYSAKYTSTLSADYEIPMGARSLTLATDWTYRSKIFFDAANFEENSDPARVLGNVRVKLADAHDRWSVTAYVNNVTNKFVKGFGFPIAADTNNAFVGTTYNPARLWGLRLNLNYH